jgi:hypothetical protein
MQKIKGDVLSICFSDVLRRGSDILGKICSKYMSVAIERFSVVSGAVLGGFGGSGAGALGWFWGGDFGAGSGFGSTSSVQSTRQL